MIVVDNNNRLEKYYYRVYGLIIESEMVLPELLSVRIEAFQLADITIQYKNMPKEIYENIENGIEENFKQQEMWFSIKGVATYYIYDGNTIIVDLFKNANGRHVKAFLIGSALGMLLLQRNTIAIHGGAMIIEGKAVIFTGDSGAGKSTLVSALRQKGYRFLADDVSAVSTDENRKHIVFPSYPQQKLCLNTMRKMGYDTEKFILIDEDREKYVIPIWDGFVKEPVHLGAIFLITIGDSDNVEIEKISGKEKLVTLIRSVYRIEVTSYTGYNPVYFKKCIDLVKNISFFKIIRPRNQFSVEQQINVIENTIKDINKISKERE